MRRVRAAFKVVADGMQVVAFARVGGNLFTTTIDGASAGPWEALPTGVLVLPVRGAPEA